MADFFYGILLPSFHINLPFPFNLEVSLLECQLPTAATDARERQLLSQRSESEPVMQSSFILWPGPEMARFARLQELPGGEHERSEVKD
jgi:hypothetical protein